MFCVSIFTIALCAICFCFNDTATTEIYTLSLRDALPISQADERGLALGGDAPGGQHRLGRGDRKSTRLNSSHPSISYAVFCLNKNNVIGGPSAFVTPTCANEDCGRTTRVS